MLHQYYKPIEVVQEENYKKFILIYVSAEANDDHAKILEKYDAAYGIGLRYATGQLVEIEETESISMTVLLSSSLTIMQSCSSLSMIAISA